MPFAKPPPSCMSPTSARRIEAPGQLVAPAPDQPPQSTRYRRRARRTARYRADAESRPRLRRHGSRHPGRQGRAVSQGYGPAPGRGFSPATSPAERVCAPGRRTPLPRCLYALPSYGTRRRVPARLFLAPTATKPNVPSLPVFSIHGVGQDNGSHQADRNSPPLWPGNRIHL